MSTQLLNFFKRMHNSVGESLRFKDTRDQFKKVRPPLEWIVWNPHEQRSVFANLLQAFQEFRFVPWYATWNLDADRRMALAKIGLRRNCCLWLLWIYGLWLLLKN